MAIEYGLVFAELGESDSGRAGRGLLSQDAKDEPRVLVEAAESEEDALECVNEGGRLPASLRFCRSHRLSVFYFRS